MEIQYPLTGGPEEKLTACLKAAGWYKGRKVRPEKMKQITDFYASGGIALPAGAKDFISEFHGLAEGWYLNLSAEKYLWRPPDTLFKIFPDHEASELDYPARLDREDDPICLKDDLEMMCDLAGEPVVWIGIIGYNYPVRIYMGSTSKIFVMSAWYDTAVYSSLTEMMISAFEHHPEWSFVTMRQIYDVPARPIPQDKSGAKDLVQKKKEEAGYMDYPYRVGVQTFTDEELEYYDMNMHDFLIGSRGRPWGFRAGQGPLSVNEPIIGYVDLTDGRQDGKERLLVWTPTPEEEERNGSNNPFYSTLFEERKIYRIRGLVPKDPAEKAKGGIRIIEILSADEQSEFIEGLFEEYYRTEILESEIFGELRYTKKDGDYSSACNWQGRRIPIYLSCEPEDAEQALKYLEQMYTDQKQWDKKMRDFIVDELLSTANDWLSDGDEPEITGEEFARRITISSIEMYDDGSFTIYFDDDDIFAGHSIDVYGNMEEGIKSADLIG